MCERDVGRLPAKLRLSPTAEAAAATAVHSGPHREAPPLRQRYMNFSDFLFCYRMFLLVEAHLSADLVSACRGFGEEDNVPRVIIAAESGR